MKQFEVSMYVKVGSTLGHRPTKEAAIEAVHEYARENNHHIVTVEENLLTGDWEGFAVENGDFSYSIKEINKNR